MLEPTHAWRYPDREPPDAAFVAEVAAHGGSARLARIIARRGVALAELGAFFGPPEAGLHDPAGLPDATRLVERIARARDAGERILVFGDFDADGLCGLAILVRTLRRLGLDACPHVPSRIDDGHGLSLRAVEAARADGRTLIVTVDTGTSSAPEIARAAELGIDVVVTDHHRVPPDPPPAVALVNPHRPDATYPDRRLTGSGVALKVAELLLDRFAGGRAAALDLADLAAVGTVADVAPVLGENRAIARLGLARLRAGFLPGFAALLDAAGVAPAAATLETVAFVIAPRLNAAGRVGAADDAAALLLADDPVEATAIAGRLEGVNAVRRDLTKAALEDARRALVEDPAGDCPATMIRGTWPVGVIGLVAGRLAEETSRPAVVATEVGNLLRGSCRAGDGVDLAGTLEACDDLLVRHGGHRGAAGFEILPDCWDAFRVRFAELVGVVPRDPRPVLMLDLAVSARGVDYALVRELAALEPTGPGNPAPVVGVHGLTVTRVRAAAGGHAQLTLRRELDVLDAIAFHRGDLVDALRPGDRVDVAARVASRTFAGYETLQLEVLDVALAKAPAAVAPPGLAGAAVR